MIIVFREEHDGGINGRCKSVEEEESRIGTDPIDISNGVSLVRWVDDWSMEARASKSLSGVGCMSGWSVTVYQEFTRVGLKESTSE